MDLENHIDEQRLLDYYSGSLAAAERREVEEWIGRSEENKKVARDVEYICMALDTIATIKTVDTETGWRKVRNRIAGKRSRVFLMWFQRVAAVLFIPLLFAFVYLMSGTGEVEWIEVKTSPGLISSVSLPDGSKVWLNSGSSLKYPQKFTGGIREVELDGEAYFSVEKDPSKRFVVATPFDVKAEVLGTEFDMEAYKEGRKVKTSLVSGSVKLTFDRIGQEVMLKPKELVEYDVKTRKCLKSNANLAMLTSWKDGVIIFRNTTLEEALEILSKRYNARFVVKNDLLYNYSFTGSFKDQHLSLILEHFRISSGIQYRYVTPQMNLDQLDEKTIVELY